MGEGSEWVRKRWQEEWIKNEEYIKIASYASLDVTSVPREGARQVWPSVSS
jgi:hypothetical protein